MDHRWSFPVDHTGLVSLLGLATQCALAWVFAAFFLALLRTAASPGFFRAWTWAWLARAIALSAMFARFFAAMIHADPCPYLEAGSVFERSCTAVYQGAKLLNAGGILAGALLFASIPLGRTRELLGGAVLVATGVLSALLTENSDELLIAQAAVVIPSSALAALILLRLPPERRSLGTKLSGSVLVCQGCLWALYSVVFVQTERGIWPDVRTLWTALGAHNSFFDLGIDVLLASSLVVLLLQDVHRSRLAAEAERARLRLELGRAEKLRSLGKLVSGVAHELNNPLTAILGFAESIGQVGSESERVRATDIIREQALRCRRIVRGLATFSGEETDQLESIALTELLQRVARGFEFELGRHRLALAIDAPGTLPRISGDHFGLEQLFANLLSNAIQASPPDAVVTMRTRAGATEIEVEVEDSGPGIPPALLERIFEPFFTTKEPGSGVGLGLAVAHGIARAHGGSIRAENRAGGGARLTVRLPLRSLPPRREPSAPLPVRELPRPPARPSAPRPAGAVRLELLVIEDEPLLCEMLKSFGARRGWSVVTAGSGQDGLERLRREGERFDVVLCDLRMPPPSGIEIHDRMRCENPQLLERFLFLTGDLSSVEAATFAARCSRPILRKPFELSELAAHVEGIGSVVASP